MITIKLPFQSTPEALEHLKLMQREQSSVIRWAFNRVGEGLKQKEIRDLTSNLQNIGNLDSWFIQSAIINALALGKAMDGKSTIFGGKKWFKLRQEGKITSEEWKEKRLQPLHIEGESPNSGNRKFDLDLDNNQVIFKPKCGLKFALQLPNVKKNYWIKLRSLEELCKLKECPYTIDLTSEFISFSFELNEVKRLKSVIKRAYTEKSVRDKAKEKLEKLEAQSTKNPLRVLGIDQNPNYMGVSVLEFDDDDKFRVIHKEVLDFSELNKKSGEASSSNKSKNLINKKKFELIEGVNHVVTIAKHFQCSKISIESLKFKSGSTGCGKGVNRLCKNVWHRLTFSGQINKKCQEEGIELVEVNAAYTSTIGNLNYGDEATPDMVASSIEIARRAFKKFTKGWFYPSLKNDENLKNLWKEDLDFSSLSWIEIHQKIKETGVKYRFLLENCIPKTVFSLNSYKSGLKIINF
jgi:IS605 OrfB family transposase